MKVTKDKVVSFEFKVTNEQGEVIDSSEGIGAFPYIHGNGYLIPGLEDALEGKSTGDSFSISVPPALGYGERDDNMIQVIPKDGLEGVELEIGMKLEAKYGDESRIVTVVGIDDTGITMDGNHALAGLTLSFDITIVEIRDATPEELERGLSHMQGGCGCGCEEDACGESCDGC